MHTGHVRHRGHRRRNDCRACRRNRARPGGDAGAGCVVRRVSGGGQALRGRLCHSCPPALRSTVTTRVLIVDDQSLVRAGFRLILESQPDLAVIGEAPDGEQAVALARRHRPEVVLMDIRMPRMDGLEATRRILADGLSGCRIVMLTTFDLDEYVYAALRVGACGFLLKDVTPEQLIASVRLVAAGDALLAPSITRRLIERYASRDSRTELTPDLSSLTEREVDVLRLMARGLANQAI